MNTSKGAAPAPFAISSNGSMIAVASKKNEARLKCFKTSPTSQLQFSLHDNQSKTNHSDTTGAEAERSIAKVLYCINDTFIFAQLKDSNSIIGWDLNRGVVTQRITIPSNNNDLELHDIAIRSCEGNKETLVALALSPSTASKRKVIIFEYDILAQKKEGGKLLSKVKAGTVKKRSRTQEDETDEEESSRNYTLTVSPDGEILAVFGGGSIKTVAIQTGNRRTISLASSTSSSPSSLEHSPMVCFTKDSSYICAHSSLVSSKKNKENKAINSRLTFYSVMEKEDTKKKNDTSFSIKETSSITSMYLEDTCAILSHTDGTSTLLHSKDGFLSSNTSLSDDVVESYQLSLPEEKSIVQAIFHPQASNTKLLFVYDDQGDDKVAHPLCDTFVYAQKDGTIILQKNHLLTHDDEDTRDKATDNNKKKRKQEKSQESMSKKKKSSEKNNDVKFDEDFVELGNNQLSIADQLRALEKKTDYDSDDNVEGNGNEKTDDTHPSLSKTDGDGGRSFHIVLKQALQSNDDSTLEETVFYSKAAASDHSIITNSISTLPMESIHVLLSKIVHRVAVTPKRLSEDHILRNWIQCILVHLYKKRPSGDIGVDTYATNSTEDKKYESMCIQSLTVLRNIISNRTSSLDNLIELDAHLKVTNGEL